MNKLALVKGAVSTVVGIGAGKIISAIVENNTTPQNVADKVTLTAGAYVLGAMVADISVQYTNAKIDQLVVFVNENFKK